MKDAAIAKGTQHPKFIITALQLNLDTTHKIGKPASTSPAASSALKGSHELGTTILLVFKKSRRQFPLSFCTGRYISTPVKQSF
jgi:hypothetical protein